MPIRVLDRTIPPLLVNQPVPLLLLAILDQAQSSQKGHHIDRDETKEGGEDNIQELIGKASEWSHAASKSSCGGSARAGSVSDEQSRVVIAAALKSLLQH